MQDDYRFHHWNDGSDEILDLGYLDIQSRSDSDQKYEFKNLKDHFEKYPCPPNITTLICNGRQLKTLHGCPKGIIRLDCSYNNLKTLIGAPDTLKCINCSTNNLKSLIGCPKNLISLNCYDNQLLETLKGCPEGLYYLECGGNRLKSLQYCPKSVRELLVNYAELKSLYGCPTKLKLLQCQGNEPLLSLAGCPPTVKDPFCIRNDNLYRWPSDESKHLPIYNKHIRPRSSTRPFVQYPNILHLGYGECMRLI